MNVYKKIQKKHSSISFPLLYQLRSSIYIRLYMYELVISNIISTILYYYASKRTLYRIYKSFLQLNLFRNSFKHFMIYGQVNFSAKIQPIASLSFVSHLFDVGIVNTAHIKNFIIYL